MYFKKNSTLTSSNMITPLLRSLFAVLMIQVLMPLPSARTARVPSPISPSDGSDFGDFFETMVEDEFKQLMEKTPLQHVNSGRKLLILVMSPRENVDQRRAIRETWAKDSPNVFFLVSKKYCPYPSSWLKFGPDGPCTLEEDYSEKIARNALSESQSELLTEIKEIQAKLTKVIEQEENVGLLESTDSDSDGALRAKLAFEWAYEHTDFNAETAGGESEQEEELLYGLEHEDSKLRFFPGLESSPPSWILKTDDDCIVRPESYERMLAANFNGTRYFHHGISERPDTRLGYVLSMDLIKHLYSTLQEVEADQYEDEASAVTAWLEVEPEDEIEYVVTDSNQLVLLENSINSQACQPSESPDQHPEYDADTLLLGRGLSADEINYCWRHWFSFMP